MSAALGAFRISTIADATHGKNHDVSRVSDHCVVVVDGATPLASIGHATAGSVRALSRAVAEALGESAIDEPVGRFLGAAEATLIDDGSSAVAAALWRVGDRMIGATVGDCVVAVATLDGQTSVLFDHTLTDLDDTAVAKMYERDGVPHRADAAELLVSNRKRLNTAEGYGAFGPAGMMPHHVQHASWSIDDVATALVCSDGFWRALDTYGIYDSPAALIDDAARDLDSVVHAIRAVESADTTGRQYPRISNADDITAVVLHRR